MDNESLCIAILASARALELLDEFDGGFVEHPAVMCGVELSETQAQNALLFLAWWDCATCKRIIENGLTQEQADGFAQSFLFEICERVGRTRFQATNESATDVQFGLEIYHVVAEALNKVWNDGIESGQRQGFAALLGLKAMGITLAETENYKEIFLKTLRLLHDRTMGLAELIRKETGWSDEEL